jgi:hypothetical protein
MSNGAFTPHRGVLILVLGILGIVMCFLLSIPAWIMGNTDLAEIDAGRMDPEGRGLTQAGKVLGIIGVAWGALWLVLGTIWLVFVLVVAAAN